MELRRMYDGILELQEQLQAELLARAAVELQYTPAIRSGPDFRKIQVLSACFTLQEYLANAIAVAMAAGDLPPEEAEEE